MSDELQNYYLDAMGIQRWLPQEGGDAVESFTNTSTQTSWQALQEEVKACQRCALSQSRTQVVFGVGNPQADVMIVGEAPGFHEDRQGEPFVGRAGQLLNKMLQAVGLEREQVFIGNVLKCRPPQNRDPQPEEIKECTPYLERQVAHISPKLIVAVGRYAAHYLLGCTNSLRSLRNKMHSFGKLQTPVIVSYHPAYLLRNPADKGKAYSDWQQVAKLIEAP